MLTHSTLTKASYK